MKTTFTFKIILLIILICYTSTVQAAPKMRPLPIALSLGFSGSMASYAQNGKNAAELAVKHIEERGGITIGDKKYTIKLIVTDNKEELELAAKTTLENIFKDHVLAIVGAYNSNTTVVMSNIIERYKTPLITPWAASTKITQNKKYAFRLSAGTIIQAQAITSFISNKWSGVKGAVLYNELNSYAKETAEMFQKIFIKENGRESLTAIEIFRAEKLDSKANVSNQLKRIAGTEASFIFLPVNPARVLPIIKQAKELGIDIPFVGGDWNSPTLAQQCGRDCNGFRLTATFVPRGASGKAGEFVKSYKEAYGDMPGEEAALTYDSILILAQALSSMSFVSDDIKENRKNLRDKIAGIKNFSIVTGEVGYPESGEPKRCALLIKIEDGQLLQDRYICP